MHSGHLPCQVTHVAPRHETTLYSKQFLKSLAMFHGLQLLSSCVANRDLAGEGEESRVRVPVAFHRPSHAEKHPMQHWKMTVHIYPE